MFTHFYVLIMFYIHTTLNNKNNKITFFFYFIYVMKFLLTKQINYQINNNYNIYNNIIYTHTFYVLSVLYTFYLYLLNTWTFNNTKYFYKNFYDKIIFFLLIVILGSYWSSQEVLWGGYWNWDLVEVSILLLFLYSFFKIHVKKKKQIFNIYFLKNFIFWLFIFFFSSKLEFSSSVHAFVNNNLSKIHYWMLFIFCFFLYLLNINTIFLKKSKFALICFFWIYYYFAIHVVLVQLDFNWWFFLKFFFYFIIFTLIFKKIKIVCFMFLFFNFKFYFFFIYVFFFFKKKNKIILTHLIYYMCLYAYFVFLYSNVFNSADNYIYKYYIFEQNRIKNLFINLNFYTNYFFFSFAKLIIKFIVIFYNKYVYFYIMFYKKMYMVYFLFIKLNFFFLIIFFFQKKNNF